MSNAKPTLQEAYAYCTKLAENHYENFPVGRLVPRHLRPHVHAIYAFARHADDFADEGYSGNNSVNLKQPISPQSRLEALKNWEFELIHREQSSNPVFIALDHTIRKYQLPESLFIDLISAFKQDVVQSRYRTFNEVLDYSARSANPIGRLVLYLHQQATPETLAASDKICTALQITNFWQDVSVDIIKNRIYIPLDDLSRYNITEDQILNQTAPLHSYKALIQLQIDRTYTLFDEGLPLIKMLPWPLNFEIALTWHGGRRILQKIQAIDYNTLHHRPKLTRLDIPLLLARSLRQILTS